MIHSPASLRLLDALLDAGPAGAHREELLRQADVSPATFYRAVEPWLAAALVTDEGGRFVLKLSHPCNFAFKLWRDQMRLLELTSPLREEVAGLVEQLQKELGSNLLAFWLHGSIAQRTDTPESDIDFLAVLRKPREEENVDASRPVQVTLLSARQFREDWQLGDGFVRTILRHGLLLHDRGFAQEYLACAMPSSGARTLEDRIQRRDRLDSRFRFFIRDEMWSEAHRVLKSLTVALARFMLEPLGMIPAGKADLLAALERYFGSECQADFQAALSSTSEKAQVLLRLQRQLERWQVAFGHHAEHIQQMVAACSAPAPVYESACRTMLEHLFGPLALPVSVPGADFILDVAGVRWTVEAKTSKGPLDRKLLASLSGARPLLLIANPLREVAFSRRPDFDPRLSESIAPSRVTVLDSRQLLQLHLRRLLLEPNRRPKPEVLFSQIFNPTTFRVPKVDSVRKSSKTRALECQSTPN